MVLPVDGKWLRQSEIGARAIRTNELLRATDVALQRQKNACLGMAVKLQIDAVRFVLTGSHDLARKHFEAVRDLSDAAIEAGETWVFTDTFFARCEALRLRAIASWALEVPGADRDLTVAITSWEELARTEVTFDPSGRNAHAIHGLLAAHGGDFASAVVSVRSVRGCDRITAWCDLLSLLKTTPVQNRCRERGSSSTAESP